MAEAIMSPELRARLAKLIAMLGAPTDGEVLNAARLIDQALRVDGFLLHDLGEFIRLGGVAGSPFIDAAGRLLRGMVQEAVGGAWALSASEREFVQDYERKFNADRHSISQSEFDRLEALCRQVRRRTGMRN